MRARDRCGSTATNKGRCNEECLRKIAARLCRLDDHRASDSSGQAAGACDQRVADAGDLQGSAIDYCCSTKGEARGCGNTQPSTPDKTNAPGNHCSSSCCDVKEEKGYGLAGVDVTHAEGSKNASAGCSNDKSALKGSSITANCCANDENPDNTAGYPCHMLQANLVEQESPSVCVDKCCESVRPFDVGASHESTACSTHLQAAFDRFEALIRQSKCICRSVVRQMGVSCCALSADGSVAAKEPLSSACMVPQTSPDIASGSYYNGRVTTGCCEKPTRDRSSVDPIDPIDQELGSQSKSDGCCAGKDRRGTASDGCCEDKQAVSQSMPKQLSNDITKSGGCRAGKERCSDSDGRCEGNKRATQQRKIPQTSESRPKSDVCCTGKQLCSKKDGKKAASDGVSSTEIPLDVEHDAAREHITLSISGMTCTGCSTKMINVLSSMSGLSNPEVTFISGSATFELDPSITSIENALPIIEKRTGFKCSRVVEGYQHVNVYMSSELVVQLENSNPHGLVSVTKAKKTYQLTYNPHIIGARELLPPGAKLAPPAIDTSIGEGRQRLLLMIWYTVVAAAFTIPVVVLNWAPNPISRQKRDIVSLIFATVVQAIAVPEFYLGALKSLIFSKVIEMDMLVVISITAAYVYSVIAFGMTEAGYVLEQHAIFETSTLLITLVLLGKLMAAIARTRAVRAVSIRSLQVDETYLLLPDGGTTTIDARLLQFGDSILIRPHSRVVTDCTVVSGTSSVDESMLTGETVPVEKAKGDTVIAGTLNGESTLHARIVRLPGANSVDDIAKSVEKALSAKPRIQDLADKVASWFVPTVVAIALIVFAIWIAVALKVRGENPGGTVGTAITYAIAVLAVSCPCALGLAVPMVLVIAGGVAAQTGVVIKAAIATERSYQATDVVFDKTGTLTTGDLSVVSQAALGSDLTPTEAMSLAASLLKDDRHPVARAVATYLESHRLQPMEVDAINSVPGSGIQAEWNNKFVKIGNAFWLGIENNESVAALLSDGMTCLCLSLNDIPVFAFGLKDRIREEAAAVTSALRKRKITCHIVSGDHAKAVENVASTLGLDRANVASSHSPTQKQQYVQDLQDAGKTVIFCGDGTNDAVALAQANVGVQMGTASDVSGAVADVVLLGGLEGLPTLLDVSKRAFARITFNFVWSAVYNVFAILLAAGAFVKFRIPPAYAGLGEIVSIGPVILAAMTLLIKRKGKRTASTTVAQDEQFRWPRELKHARSKK